MCQTRAVNFQNPKAGEVTTVADFLRNSAVRDPDRIAFRGWSGSAQVGDWAHDISMVSGEN